MSAGTLTLPIRKSILYCKTGGGTPPASYLGRADMESALQVESREMNVQSLQSGTSRASRRRHPIMNEREEEYPISNSRSEAKTGFSVPKAMTERNGNEYPISKVGQDERPTSNFQRPISNKRQNEYRTSNQPRTSMKLNAQYSISNIQHSTSIEVISFASPALRDPTLNTQYSTSNE